MATPRKKPTLAAKRPPAKRRTTSATKAPVRRRKTVKKKGFLSDAFSPAAVTSGGKAVISGAAGGAGAMIIAKFLGTDDPKKVALWQLGGGLAAAVILKLPNVGAGMAAVAAANFMQQSGFLSDGPDDYSNADFTAVDLELLPTTLSDEFLQDEYLQDEYLQDGEDIGFSYMNY